MEQDKPSTHSEPQHTGNPPNEEDIAANRSQSAPNVVGSTGQPAPAPPLPTTYQTKNNPAQDAQPPEDTNMAGTSRLQPFEGNSERSPEVNPLINSTLADLHPLEEPLLITRDTEGSINTVRLRMTMLQAPYTFLNDPWKPDGRERYDRLVELGINALGVPRYLPERHLSRNERTYFKEELQVLDRLLTEVFQYKSPEGLLAYSLKYALFHNFMELITQLKSNTLEKISSLSKETFPEIPRWGRDNRPIRYWKPIDFEILGVNFRLQTETLLIALADGIRERNRLKAQERNKGKQRAKSIEQASRSKAEVPFTNVPRVLEPTIPQTPREPRSPSPRTTEGSQTRRERPSSREDSSRSPHRYESSPRPTGNPFRNQEETLPQNYHQPPREQGYDQRRREERDFGRTEVESSVSRYRPASPVRPRHPVFMDPRPLVLHPTFPSNPAYIPPSTHPLYSIPMNFEPPMFGGVRDNTTSRRLQQLLAPSQITNQHTTYPIQPVVDSSMPHQNTYQPTVPPNRGGFSGGYGPPPPPPRNPMRGGASAPAPGGGGGDEPSDSDDGGRGRSNRNPRVTRERRRSRRRRDREDETTDSTHTTVRPPPEPRFDTKFRVDIIPTWNGNADDLGRWIMKINRLARQSQLMYEQLGSLVPTRLEGTAEKWYYSLSSDTRSRLEENWDSLRQGICDYFMNQTWMENQKVRANNAKYREIGHGRETPSDYFIRKLELLQLNFNYNDRELINQIMAGVPTHWMPILTPHLYYHVEQLQAAVKFFEDTLLKMDPPKSYQDNQNNFTRYNPRNPFNKFRNSRANANLIDGNTRTPTSVLLPKPQFPKDNTNVSKRATPESVGKRPCRYCGSGRHWDYECRYARKGERLARANLVEYSNEELEEQLSYDETYYDLQSEDEDFPEALLNQEQ